MSECSPSADATGAAARGDSPASLVPRTPATASDERLGAVGWPEALRTWSRIALLSFGGPTGQIAVMHRILVDEKKWVTEERFLHALNFCMLLPGPEAQQLATYLGWLMHRTLGGLAAGTLFILPGFLAILGLSIVYVEYQHLTFVEGVFFGLKPAVIAIVAEAVMRIGKRVLKQRPMLLIAALSFVAIFFFGTPFPLLILVAAVAGYVGGIVWPDWFLPLAKHGSVSGAGGFVDEFESEHVRERISTRPLPQATWGRAMRVSALCLPLWFGPVALVAWWQGSSSVYVDQGLFFSKAALVTFGGAYSVLSYVAQQAVERFGWLQPQEMLDGLGLAETTPGPLIMVVQFVAFLGASRNPGTLSPLTAGIVGSVLTTWVTFVPCFYWIFLGAPYIERLRRNRRWNTALTAITAAVVGVVLNLAVWFAVHTLFGRVETVVWGPLRMLVPDWASWRWAEASLALLAAVLIFVARRGIAQTLAVCAALGVLLACAEKWLS